LSLVLRKSYEVLDIEASSRVTPPTGFPIWARDGMVEVARGFLFLLFLLGCILGPAIMLSGYLFAP